jgi:lipopolysaccharide export LptBFGC system permease protein LptF
MLPAGLLGAVAMGLSVWLSASAGPNARQAADGLLREVIMQQKTLVFKPYQFLDTGRGLNLYVEGTNQRQNTVQGLHVFCLQGEGDPMLLWAPQARFGATTLQVPTPRFYVLDSTGALTWGDSESIDIDLTQVSMPSAGRSSAMQDMTLAELRQHQRESAAAGPTVARSYVMELHSRFAMAFACVVFAFVAGPVTWWFGRGQSFVGVLATILMVFVFYVIMLWTRMLGTSGVLPPLVAAWGQDALLLGTALVAIWRQR